MIPVGCTVEDIIKWARDEWARPVEDDEDPLLRFLATYDRLAAEGVRDTRGGYEFSRILCAWGAAGSPHDVEDFIRRGGALDESRGKFSGRQGPAARRSTPKGRGGHRGGAS